MQNKYANTNFDWPEDGASRRQVLKGLAAIGLSGPAAIACLRSAESAQMHTLMSPNEFSKGMERLIQAAGTPELHSYTSFEITGPDMPWKDIGIEVAEGQNVTFLVGGRWWIVRDLDVWVEPGMAFFARVGGESPIYNPMSNTGTMHAPRSGPITVARAIGEWVDEKAEELATPLDVYQQADGRIEAVALVWNGSPLSGLRSLLAHGDVAGALREEVTRLETEPAVPDGWRPMFMFGNAGIFSSCADGEICCHTHKNVCILQRDVSLPLAADTFMDWRWNVQELPSQLSEDQALNHDYLSMAIEFDDGQDMTYMWSTDLPEGHVFRCPLPRWTPIETHMVVRTGHAQLGQWISESRNVYEDYKQHIGGDATRVVRVWIIANTVFQRRTGLARFSDIVVRDSNQEVKLT